jgi:hypothetical protein
VLTHTARSLLGKIVERSIKNNKTSTTEEQGQHQATGSGAGKASTAEPTAELQPMPLSWPLAQWGLDMVGKLQKSWPGGHVYMLVAVDKFTKWVEAAPVTT